MTVARRKSDVDPMRLTTPEGYEGWTADQKWAWLWNTLIGGTAHTETQLPPLVLPFKTSPLAEASIVLRPAELDKALTRTSDLMEVGRPKVIHAKGAVAGVQLVTVDRSPYTGLLAPAPDGGATGLLRMSLVAKVDRKASFTPALALKLLVDGQPSADVLAMNHTVGQGRDFNLFSNTMTNDLSSTHSELRLAQRLMSRLFERISHQPRRMVSSHLAERTSDGGDVDDPRAPQRLIFEPTTQARELFRGRADVDFRLVLAEVPAGTELYTVTGVEGDGREPIGVVRTTTSFVSSDGGDRLYFRHVHAPEDRKR